MAKRALQEARSPPAVIAHRGASGYLPEHTLPAKALAHAMGADYLEQDVVATRDGHLIVFHDLHLDDVTDVRSRFPGRSRDDGLHYCIDFDLAEIRQLAVGERRRHGSEEARFPRRFPAHVGLFSVPTLDEELAFIGGLNRSIGRRAGIYPEVKNPAWHRAQGVDIAASMLPILRRYGYTTPNDPAWIQCFDPAELQRLRHELGSELRLVLLLEGSRGQLTVEGLAAVAGYADAIGPSLRLVLEKGEDGRPRPASLIADAHAAGLAVHPYTVRADELPPGISGLDELLGLLLKDGKADGLFTDFPDLVHRFIHP